VRREASVCGVIKVCCISTDSISPSRNLAGSVRASTILWSLTTESKSIHQSLERQRLTHLSYRERSSQMVSSAFAVASSMDAP